MSDPTPATVLLDHSHEDRASPRRTSGSTGQAYVALAESGLLRIEPRSRSQGMPPLCVRTSGTCMEPWLRDGQKLTVEVRFAWPGDVVVFFDQHRRLVAHRLLGYRIGSFGGSRGRHDFRFAWVTAADRGGRLDPPVGRDQQVGVVSAVDGQARLPSWSQRLRSTVRFLRFGGQALWRRAISGSGQSSLGPPA